MRDVLLLLLLVPAGVSAMAVVHPFCRIFVEVPVEELDVAISCVHPVSLVDMEVVAQYSTLMVEDDLVVVVYEMVVEVE